MASATSGSATSGSATSGSATGDVTSSASIFSVENSQNNDFIELDTTQFFEEMYKLKLEIEKLVKGIEELDKKIEWFNKKSGMISTQEKEQNKSDVFDQNKIKIRLSELETNFSGYLTQMPQKIFDNYNDILFSYKSIFSRDLISELNKFIISEFSDMNNKIFAIKVSKTNTINANSTQEKAVDSKVLIKESDIDKEAIEEIVNKYRKQVDSHHDDGNVNLEIIYKFLQIIIDYAINHRYTFLSDTFFYDVTEKEKKHLQSKLEFLSQEGIKHLYDINIICETPEVMVDQSTVIDGIKSVDINFQFFTLATIIPSEISHDFKGRTPMKPKEFKEIINLLKKFLPDSCEKLLDHVMNEDEVVDFLIKNLLPWSFKRHSDDVSLQLINPKQYKHYKGTGIIPNFVKMDKVLLLCSDSITKSVDPVSYALTSNNNSLLKYDAGNVTPSFSASEISIINNKVPVLKFYYPGNDDPIIVVSSNIVPGIARTKPKLKFVVNILSIESDKYIVLAKIDDVSVTTVYNLYTDYLAKYALPFLQPFLQRHQFNKIPEKGTERNANILHLLLELYNKLDTETDTSNEEIKNQIKNQIKNHFIRIICILFLKTSGDLIYIVALSFEMTYKRQLSELNFYSGGIREDYDMGVLSSGDYSLIQSSLINITFNNNTIKSRDYNCCQIIAFTHIHHTDLIFPVTLMQKFITNILIILTISPEEYKKLIEEFNDTKIEDTKIEDTKIEDTIQDTIQDTKIEVFSIIRNIYENIVKYDFLKYFDVKKTSQRIFELYKKLISIPIQIEIKFTQYFDDVITKLDYLKDDLDINMYGGLLDSLINFLKDNKPIISGRVTTFFDKRITNIFDQLINELEALQMFTSMYNEKIKSLNNFLTLDDLVNICDKILTFTKRSDREYDMDPENPDVEISSFKIPIDGYLFAELIAHKLFLTDQEQNERERIISQNQATTSRDVIRQESLLNEEYPNRKVSGNKYDGQGEVKGEGEGDNVMDASSIDPNGGKRSIKLQKKYKHKKTIKKENKLFIKNKKSIKKKHYKHNVTR